MNFFSKRKQIRLNDLIERFATHSRKEREEYLQLLAERDLFMNEQYAP